MFTIKEINVEKTYPLRIEILRNGIAKNYHFAGDNHKSTFHLAAFKDNECIGIVTFIPNSHSSLPNIPSFQLRGMAVSKIFQKQGIGKLLIKESIRILNEKNCKILWCNAREIAVKFYKKMEFSIKGSKFQIPGIGTHYMMFKMLND